MGWTGVRATHYKNYPEVDRHAECDAYWLEGLNAGRFAVVKSAMVGTVYYAAIRPLVRRTGHNDEVEPIPESEQETFAAVFLTQTDKRSFWNFAYKDMNETMGPCYYDCPKSILRLLSKTDNENALNWREKCIEKQEQDKVKKAKKKILDNLPVGSVIEFASQLDFINPKIKRGDIVQITKTQRYVRGKLKTLWLYENRVNWRPKHMPLEFIIIA